MRDTWDGDLEFEAAVGRFVLAFGLLEELVGRAVARELVRLGRRNPLDAESPFGQRLMALDLLQAGARDEALRALPLDRIRALARERNAIIHGLSARNGREAVETPAEKARTFPPDRLDRLTAEAQDLIDALYAFVDD